MSDMCGPSRSKFVAAVSAALSMMLWASGAAVAATIDPIISIGDIPESGNPNFTFEDPNTQGGGDFSDTISSWYENYTLILPTDTGYEVFAHNSGDFDFEQFEGEHYDGDNGSLSINVELDKDGTVVDGQYTVSGEISDLGITSTEVLTTGEITDFEIEDNVLGFATDNISCAPEIQNCLVAESVYIFADGTVPELADLDGVSGYAATSASLTTVPLPGSVVMFMSALALLVGRKRLPTNKTT